MANEKEENLRASRGIKWNLLEQAGVAVITFVSTVILSRILRPEDFGLYGMPTVLTNLAILFVTLGLHYSVIQDDSLDRNDHESIFWLSMTCGVLAALLFFFGAPLIATVYGHRELVPMVRALSLVLVIQGAASVPMGIIIKRMDFKSLAIAQISGTGLSYGIAILLAMNQFGYWALVAQALTFNATLVLINLISSGWRPRWTFRFSALQKIRRFSTHFTLNQVLEFSAANLDAFLVGRQLGSRSLGLMSRAQALSMMPVTSFGFILNRTFFPWFSSLQQRPAELQVRYVQSSTALTVVMFPILAFLGLVSEEVVLLLFGSPWLPVAPLLKIYCWYAAVNCVNLFQDSFMTSQGRTDRLIRINLAEKAVLVSAVILGLWNYGLTGVVLAKAFTSSVFFFPRLVSSCGFVQLPVKTWLISQRRVLLALAFSSATSLLLLRWNDGGPLIRALSATLLPAVIYYVLLRWSGEPAVAMIERVLREQLGTLTRKSE